MHDREGSNDASACHRPMAEAWCRARSLPKPYLFDNRQPRYYRTRQITKAVQDVQPRLDEVAFFGHAGRNWMQAGFLSDNIDSLGTLLLGASSPVLIVEIFAIDNILDTSGLAEDGGIADKLRHVLAASGKWSGQVIAHVVGDRGQVSRVFYADKSPGVYASFDL